MRVLFLLFFLLTMPAFADETSECTPTSNTNCQNCEVKGKYCASGSGPIGNQCLPCSEGAYCPGDQKQYCCAGISGTNGAFPYSDQDIQNAIGAKSKYECYKKLNGGNNTGEGPKCKNEHDSSITYNDNSNTNKCRQYYRESTQTPYVSCDGEPGTDNGGNPIEPEESDYHDSGYHMEGNQCYSNIRDCKFFNPEGDRVGISGQLYWNVFNGKKWQNTAEDANFCIRKQNSDSKHCYGEVDVSVSGEATTVGTTHISFPDSNTTTCLGCLAGYAACNSNDCTNNWQTNGCLPVGRGYYSEGCGTLSDGVERPNCYTQGTGVTEYRIPCYAGMTTSSDTSTSRSACQYTNDTQFCDAYGCIGLSSVTGSSSWKWFMSND